MSDITTNREKRQLDNEKLLNRRILNNQQKYIANELLNGMGKDIDDVLSGKVKVKLSWTEKFKYKFKFWINKLFKIF